jgi:hypothetical protein
MMCCDARCSRNTPKGRLKLLPFSCIVTFTEIGAIYGNMAAKRPRGFCRRVAIDRKHSRRADRSVGVRPARVTVRVQG